MKRTRVFTTADLGIPKRGFFEWPWIVGAFVAGVLLAITFSCWHINPPRILCGTTIHEFGKEPHRGWIVLGEDIPEKYREAMARELELRRSVSALKEGWNENIRVATAKGFNKGVAAERKRRVADSIADYLGRR